LPFFNLRDNSIYSHHWPISHPLPVSGFNRCNRPLPIVHLATVPQEIVVGEIFRQMLFADRVVDADHPALDERKTGFDGVGVDVAKRIFAFGVADGIV
jgi:hypothetical protein